METEAPAGPVAAPPAQSARLWTPLRIRGVRHLVAAQALSDLGDGFSYIALAWLTLEVTGSSLALSGVLATQAALRAVFTLVGGATSDRFSPRTQMVISSTFRTLLMAILAALALGHVVHLWQLYVLGSLFGVVDAFFQPARSSALPSIVAPGGLLAANSLLSAASRTALIAGPALGGVLVATAGAGPAFVVDATCFLLLIVAVATIGRGEGAGAGEPAGGGDGEGAGSGDGAGESEAKERERDGGTVSLARQITEGLRYAFSDPRIRAVLGIDAVVTFSYAGPLTVGLASLVKYRFAENSAAFGAMDAAIMVGALLGALLGGVVRLKPKLGLLIAALAGWLAVGMVLLGFAHSLPAAIAVAFAIGLGTGFEGVFGVSWIQRAIDPKVLGRVMSVDMVAGYATGPISLIITGALGQHHLGLLYLGTAALLAMTAVAVVSSSTVRGMN